MIFPLTGTPITGFVVCAAIAPGSAAESPAIAMMTFAGEFSTIVFRCVGVRCADAITTSWDTPNWRSMSRALSPTSLSDLLARTTRTSAITVR